MAYEGKSPDSDWIQLAAKTAPPTFPGTATDAYKEGTLFYSNATGTAPTPKGVYIYTTDDGTATGTYGFQILSPNNNATNIASGNLAPEYGGVPCATIVPFAKDVSSTGLPTGWLLCDGSALDRTSYATLFNAMGGDGTGTSTGGGLAFGDGTTGTGGGTGKFNLPDLRGFFLRGASHGASVDPDKGTRSAGMTGGATGDNVGSLQNDAFQSHTHTVAVTAFRNIGSTYNTPNSTGPQIAENTPTYTSSTPTGTTSTETRPENIYVDYIIRYL